MNRKQRRELRRDKNLIIELYSIIKKYLPNSYIKLEQDYSQKDRFIFISNTILN